MPHRDLEDDAAWMKPIARKTMHREVPNLSANQYAMKDELGRRSRRRQRDGGQHLGLDALRLVKHPDMFRSVSSRPPSTSSRTAGQTAISATEPSDRMNEQPQARGSEERGECAERARERGDRVVRPEERRGGQFRVGRGVWEHRLRGGDPNFDDVAETVPSARRRSAAGSREREGRRPQAIPMSRHHHADVVRSGRRTRRRIEHDATPASIAVNTSPT